MKLIELTRQPCNEREWNRLQKIAVRYVRALRAEVNPNFSRYYRRRFFQIQYGEVLLINLYWYREEQEVEVKYQPASLTKEQATNVFNGLWKRQLELDNPFERKIA